MRGVRSAREPHAGCVRAGRLAVCAVAHHRRERGRHDCAADVACAGDVGTAVPAGDLLRRTPCRTPQIERRCEAAPRVLLLHWHHRLAPVRARLAVNRAVYPRDSRCAVDPACGEAGRLQARGRILPQHRNPRPPGGRRIAQRSCRVGRRDATTASSAGRGSRRAAPRPQAAARQPQAAAATSAC